MSFKTDKYLSSFINNGYAVMRHAIQRGSGPRGITENSAEQCRQGIHNLIQIIGMNKPVAIFHSPVNRATNTARLVHETLQALGVSINAIRALDWLKPDHYELNNENIGTALGNAPGSFAIFISHYYDIASFLGDKKRSPSIPELYNCTIFGQGFIIPGNRQPSAT